MDSKPKGRPGMNAVAPPPEGALLLNYGQVAFLMQTSVASVRRLVDRGLLAVVPATADGKRMVRRDTLDAYLRRSEFAVRPAEDRTAEEAKAAQARAAASRKVAIKAEWNKGRTYLRPLGQGPGKPGRPRKGEKSSP